MSIWNTVSTSPDFAKKKITGGRLNGFTDINPMWRLRRLTEAFGPVGIGWKYDIVDFAPVPGADGEVMAMMFINIYVKTGAEWSEAIPGIGGSLLIAKEKSGLHSNDEAYKMALSDAIGTACKALGMSEDVYMSGSGGSKYAMHKEQSTPPQTPKEAADVVLSFGKYSGKTIREVYNADRQYLEWLAGNDKTDPDVKAEVAMVLIASKQR